MHRTFGSLAFTAAARAVWSLTADPHEPDHRLLLPVKLNLVARPTGLAFRIVDGRVQWTDAALPLDADELLHHGTGETDAADRLDEARRFLRDSLAPGPQPSNWIKHRARECQIGKDALWDAKRDLGITAFRGTDDERDRWFWRLPQNEK